MCVLHSGLGGLLHDITDRLTLLQELLDGLLVDLGLGGGCREE